MREQFAPVRVAFEATHRPPQALSSHPLLEMFREASVVGEHGRGATQLVDGAVSAGGSDALLGQ